MDSKELIKYICKNYPNKFDLSKARLNKILYLIDWKAALDRGQVLSNVNWKYNHYGPYVNEICDNLKQDDNFNVHFTYNYYGEPKEIIELKENTVLPELDEANRKIIDLILEKTAKMNFGDFIELVYSTYPVMSQSKGDDLDLVALATRYKQLKDNKEHA